MRAPIDKRSDHSRRIRQNSGAVTVTAAKCRAAKPLSDVELLKQKMNELARKIGEMNPNDPKRHEFVNELCALGLTVSMQSQKTE